MPTNPQGSAALCGTTGNEPWSKKMVVVLEYHVPDDVTYEDVQSVLTAVHEYGHEVAGALTHHMTHVGIEDCAAQVLALFATPEAAWDPAEPRELFGRLVRQVWVEWAKEQPEAKPSWLLPWEDLDEGQREVDMRIGEALFNRGREVGRGD